MQKHLLTIIAGVCLVVASLLPLNGKPVAAASTAPKVVTVVINHFEFEPQTVTVNAGDTVEWKNEGVVPHTATQDGPRPVFDSGNIQAGGTWRYVAKQKGTYSYSCTIHPYMKGKLVVQ